LEVRTICMHPCRDCAARSRALHHDDTHRTTLHSPTRPGAAQLRSYAYTHECVS
jgi:hypothetical protein